MEINDVGEQNKKNGNGKIAGLFIVGMTISLLLGAAIVFVLLKFNPDFGQTVTNITKQEKEVTVNENGIADAVEKVYDSVVVVETFYKGELYSTGSGFVYGESNDTYYMLTNYHVISDGDMIKVKFTDGSEEVVTVVGGDQYADVAVLSLKTNKEHKIVELGSSAEARVGDTVFAIGSPVDSEMFSWSVTRGILSGKNREVPISVSNKYSSDYIINLLQTDTAINSGNSGGPLCNSNGEVIGITNMKYVTTSIEGLGFAIPIEEAETYADAIIGGKDISRPLLGIKMYDYDSMYAKQYNIDSDQVGVIVAEVVEGTGASDAGLKEGDLIIGIDGKDIKTVAELRTQLYKHKVGDTISLKYIRNGKTNSANVILSKNTDS